MKKFNSLFVNILTLIVLEIIIAWFIFKTLSLTEILCIILSSIILGTIINIITRLFKKEKVNKILNIIVSSFTILVFIAQFIHYKFYDAIFSFYSMLNGTGQIMSFFSTILKVLINNWYVVLCMTIPLVLMLVFNKKINYEKVTAKRIIILIVIIIIAYFSSLLIINDNKKEPYSKYNLYYSIHSPTHALKNFGLVKTMRLDVQRYIFGFEEKPIKLIDSKHVFEEDIEYNITNIDFKTLIEEEQDLVLKEMHEYFSNSNATNKNDYTGYFEGKNLILIVGEAVNIAAIDEKHTPTLYKLTHDGISFSNFYTPIYYVSTSDGEYTALNSLLPKEGVWSFSESKNNYFPYSFGNAFKSINYETYAFHNGTSTYYDRNYTHPNIGFDKFIACGSGLNINCGLWPQSDVEMAKDTVSYYKDSEHYLAYYINISTHLNYTWNGNSMASKNRKYVQDLELSGTAKGYIATHVELDNALSYILSELEKNGTLDNTVIAMVADHYPYGLRNGEIYELRDDIEDEKFDIHKNFFSIWSPSIEQPIVIDKYGSNLDVLPTLLNMFNIEYDSRLLMGNDLMSEEEGIVIFNDRSFITSKGKYNALTTEFTKYDENISSEYLNSRINSVYNKYLYSRLILEKDYYRKVFNK